MADFNIAYNITMGVEGLYANTLHDKGGETWKGIAYKKNPTWSGWPIIWAAKRLNPLTFEHILKQDTVLEEKVQRFYKLNYWDVNQLDKFTNQPLANEMFDAGVNMGTCTAGQFLQKSLNILNNNQKLYSDLKVDGNVGAMTIASIAKLNDSKRLIKTYNGFKLTRYLAICQADPSQETFYRSWLSRVNAA